MINFIYKLIFTITSLALLLQSSSAVSPNIFKLKIEEVVNSKERTKEYTIRDKYRNPLETLTFFKVKDNITILELQPSGGNSPRGWYTEILAPLLKEKGKLIAAHFNPKESEWRAKYRKQFELQIEKEDNFSKIVMTTLSMPPKELTQPETVDIVLTFRNLHNWLKSGYLKEVLEESYKSLKKGGLFGVVEHRAPNSFTEEEMITSGYVSEEFTIRLAEEVGFVFEAKSEINANPKDSKLHPKGVWTLPPSLRLGEEDKEKYLDIGESDRMTLRFRKPK